MTTTRAAFSLSRNLRHLLVPPPSRFRAVDGFRALAVLWIIVMHCIWFQMPFITPAELARRLEAAPRWIIGGPYGVDVFFVISGFLIGCILMGEHQQRGAIDVGRFYLRRFLKLMPAYFVALGIYAATIGVNNDTIWANAIYVNNFLPGARQAMTWSWSLAIEEQFYFTFPFFLLLVFYRTPVRHRLPLLVAMLGFAVAVSGFVVWLAGVRAPIPWSLGVYDQQFLIWAERIYIKPYTRFGCLVCGVIAAHLHLTADVPGWFARNRRAAAAWFAVAIAAFAAVVVLPVHVEGPTWGAASSLTALTTYRYVLGVAVAYLLLYSLGAYGGPSSVLHAFLCWRPWYTVAQLAYSAYLLHPIVFVIVYGVLGTARVVALPLALFYVSLPLLSLLVAAVLYLAIERPFMNLRELPALRRTRAVQPTAISRHPASASISSSVVR